MPIYVSVPDLWTAKERLCDGGGGPFYILIFYMIHINYPFREIKSVMYQANRAVKK